MSDKLPAAYLALGIPLDRLPYSHDMDRLVATVSNAEGTAKTPREIWSVLVDLRKNGRLPKVGRIRRSVK